MTGTLALVSEGLLTQTQEDVASELSARLRAVFGVNLNTSPSTIMGQIVNIIAELRAFDQQVLLSVYRSFDPNSAVGQALDRIANLTGTIRKGPKPSFVQGILTFTSAGTVNNGDLFKNEDTSTNWEATGGPYSDTGGPYPEEVSATLRSVDVGPLIAQAGTAWSLISVVPGLESFTNPTDDAALGRLEETDPALRRRRQIEIFSQGLGPRAVIRAAVSKVGTDEVPVPGGGQVDTVRVDHNPDQFPVGTRANNLGIPFKAFQVSVETTPSPPPVDLQQAIAEAIFSVLGVGGEAYGTDLTRQVTDIEGEIEDISFDLIDQVPVYVAISISTAGTEQAVSPNLGEVVKAQILETIQIEFRDIGRDQLAGEYEAIVWALKQAGEITGVTDVNVQLSTSSLLGPFSDPLVIGRQERPNFDTPNVQVTVTS